MQSRECLAGLAMMRQLHFATLDLELHTNYKPRNQDSTATESIFDVDRRMAQKTCLVPPIPEDRFLCSFSHIFGGGYAAGYYSYKYSELYSADAYAALEEQDSIESRQRVGRKYRDTVLAYGGATDPKQVWREFRGRDGVQVDALLRHSGLQSATA
jgi:oligopeptidase A